MVIELANIFKSYKMTEEGLVVLKDVSVNIEAGEFVSIMGPSGSGKSTLLNIIGLLDTPDSGSYKIYGREVSGLNDDELAILRRDVFGFVFQQFNLLPRMTALANVELPLLYSRGYLNPKSAKTTLEQVGLSERMLHKPQQLSGGQQQRVAIARALINNPKIILADEPTGNLDSASGKEILAILKDLNKQGITVILITHEESIARQADRLIRIHDGEISSDERLNKSIAVSSEHKHTFKREMTPFSFSELTEHLKEGAKTLWTNKVRTSLSILGILIGVAAVITMLALGSGAKKAIQKQMAALGSNLIVLRPSHLRVAGRYTDDPAFRMNVEDAKSFEREISYIKQASPVVYGSAQVTYLDKNWNTRIVGATTSYSKMHASEPELGRFFTDQENSTRSRVTVIGDTVKSQLFGDTNPVGEFIKVNKVMFQVIGLLPEAGATGFRDQDDVIIMPIATAMYRLLGQDYIDSIDIEVANSEDTTIAQDAIEEFAIRKYNIPLSQQKDAVVVRNMADIQKAMSQTSNVMSMLLAAIAAVSLLVGGIGIMNIMLVSVTERTREIGLRKAVGARRRDIMSQFLTEAGVIGLFGGILGIAVGVSAAFLMTAVLGWTIYVSVSSVILSFVFSVSIGVVFGIWPAKKASALNPIDALRSE